MMKGAVAALAYALLLASGVMAAACGDDGGKSDLFGREPTQEAGGQPTESLGPSPPPDAGGEATSDAGGGLSTDEYFAAIKQLIDRGNARLGALEVDFPGVWEDPAATRDALQEIDAHIEGALAQLDDLDPPDEAERAHSDFRDAAASQRQLFQDIAREVADAQSSSEVTRALLAYTERMEQVNTSIAAACTALEESAGRLDIDLDLQCAGQ